MTPIHQADDADDARARLVAIVDSSSDAIVGKTLDGIITSWNSAAEQLYGYPASEVIGRSIALLVPPDREDETPALLDRIRRGERISHYETQRIRKDGRRLIVSLSLSPIQISDGSIVGAAAIAHDITARQQRDAALERYRLLVGHTRDIVLFIGLDGHIFECNTAALEAYGYDRTELLTLSIDDLRAPAQRSLVPEQMRQAATDGVVFETVHLRKDGTEFPLEVSWVAEDIGKTRILLSIARDITQRRAAEAMVQAATAEMQAAQHIAHVGSWELDLTFLENVNRNPLHWSDECFKILGYAPGEVVTTLAFFYSCVHDEDRAQVAALIEKTIREKVPTSFEYRIAWRDGSERILLQSNEVVCDASGRPIRLVGTAQDITERKRSEAQLEELLMETRVAQGEAETAVRVRDEFLLIAAHELKTPVTVIKLTAQLLAARREQLIQDTTKMDLMIHSLETGATRLARLTDDLLDVARLQTGNLPVCPVDLDLSLLVQRIAAPFLLRLLPGQQLVVDGTDTPHLVRVDPERIEQVVSNLLDNSIKYSPNGGVIRVRVLAEEDGCAIHVEDDGMGLPTGSEETIFQPFGRAKNATENAIQGMGLGLYIGRQIVAAHLGRLWAVSPGVGQGTVMHLWLPAI